MGKKTRTTNLKVATEASKRAKSWFRFISSVRYAHEARLEMQVYVLIKTETEMFINEY